MRAVAALIAEGGRLNVATGRVHALVALHRTNGNASFVRILVARFGRLAAVRGVHRLANAGLVVEAAALALLASQVVDDTVTGQGGVWR